MAKSCAALVVLDFVTTHIMMSCSKGPCEDDPPRGAQEVIDSVIYRQSFHRFQAGKPLHYKASAVCCAWMRLVLLKASQWGSSVVDGVIVCYSHVYQSLMSLVSYGHNMSQLASCTSYPTFGNHPTIASPKKR